MATKKHLGFNKVSNNIAQEYIKKGMSPKKAAEIGDATAAKIARNASPAAKKANKNLSKVKGACKTKAGCCDCGDGGGDMMDMKKKHMMDEMMNAKGTKAKAACKTKASAKSSVKCACKTKVAAKPMKAAKGKK